MAGARKLEIDEAERDLHAALREGRLAEYLRVEPGAANAALYTSVSKIVYERLTRGVERRRGHARCAVSVERLEPDCHDRHQDDVTAVREDVLRNARGPIENLYGWLTPRLRPVTVDANRRRRGERGAQQRPRLPLPGWLDAGLDGDPWLRALAVEILGWVGVPTAMQTGLWPLGAWADRKAEFTGEYGCTEAQVAADVERVLSAMRADRGWFDRYVERPLGRKQAPTAARPSAEPDGGKEPALLSPVEPYEIADARLADLAAQALDAVEARVALGEDPRHAVVDVLRLVFSHGSGAEEMDRAPGTGTSDTERIANMLMDRAAVDRIVSEIMDILDGRRCRAGSGGRRNLSVSNL